MRPLLAACWLAAAIPPTVWAQQPAGNAWVGKRVVTKFGAVLKDPRTSQAADEDAARHLGGAGRDGRTFRVYQVEAVDGDWLWLDDEDGTAEGWIETSMVIPLDQADEFYTTQIRTTRTWRRTTSAAL